MTDDPCTGNLPGLYIHIPFCIRKCGYCGFYSVTDRTLIPDFLAALRREMGLYQDVRIENSIRSISAAERLPFSPRTISHG